MRRRWLQLSLVILLVSAVTCGMAADVQVEQQGRRFLVSSQTVVAAEPAVAWRVLSDYDHLADFVPAMRSSRVISKPGQPLVIEQSGEAGVLLFRFTIDVVLDIDERPPHRLGFSARSGNMRQMRGEWRIEPEGAGIRLHYTAELEPAFWVPPLLGAALLRRDIASQIGGVIGEMERRQTRINPQAITQPAK